jgi:hypothetical protein
MGNSSFPSVIYGPIPLSPISKQSSSERLANPSGSSERLINPGSSSERLIDPGIPIGEDSSSSEFDEDTRKIYVPNDDEEFIDPRLNDYPIPLVAKTVDLHNDDT